MGAIPSELLQQIANPQGGSNVLEMFMRGNQQAMQNEQMGWRREQQGQQRQHQNALLGVGNMAAKGDYAGAGAAAFASGDVQLGQGFITMDQDMKRKAALQQRIAGDAPPMVPPAAPPSAPKPQAGPDVRYLRLAKEALEMGDEELAKKYYFMAQEGPEAIKPTDQLAVTKALGDEPGTKAFRDGNIILHSMRASINDKNAVSDLDFIYGTAKMMDPSGRVTDQDAQMALLQQSAPKQLWGAINKFLNGGGELSPEVRSAMYELGRRRMTAARDAAIGEETDYRQQFPDFNIRQTPDLPEHYGTSQNMQRPEAPQSPNAGGAQAAEPDAEGWTRLPDGRRIRQVR